MTEHHGSACWQEAHTLVLADAKGDCCLSTALGNIRLCSPGRQPKVVLACRASMYIVKTQWEREEAWFMGVSLMVLFVSPRNSCRESQLLLFAAMLSARPVQHQRAATMLDAPAGLMPAFASTTDVAGRAWLHSLATLSTGCAGRGMLSPG